MTATPPGGGWQPPGSAPDAPPTPPPAPFPPPPPPPPPSLTPAPTPPGTPVARWVTPWRSVHGLGVALQILLWCAAAAWLLHAGALGWQRSVAEDAFALDFSALADLQDADDAVAGTGGIALLLGLAVFVLVIIWLWRASKNLEVLGRFRPTLGPGWAIGGWFIPFASWVLPAIVLTDAWRGSDPTVAVGDPQWKRARPSGVFWLWWLSYVAGWLLLVIGGGFTNEAGDYETYADFRSGNAFQLAGSIVLGTGAVFAALFVRALTARQDLWGRHLGYQPPPGGYGPPPGWPGS